MEFKTDSLKFDCKCLKASKIDTHIKPKETQEAKTWGLRRFEKYEDYEIDIDEGELDKLKWKIKGGYFSVILYSIGRMRVIDSGPGWLQIQVCTPTCACTRYFFI